jgi:tRNA threonylcarbamoyladenosine biosynthesis protein TsaB
LKILALDTATEVCSVALLIGDTVRVRELPPGPGHSAHILELVQAVLGEAAVTLQALDCIAFGRGPGGFTGVRLAASVTQGLAFGADLKVVPV